MSIGAYGAFRSGASTITEAWEILSESLTEKKNLILIEGIRGTRSQASTQVVEGLKDPSGQVTINPGFTFLTAWLSRMLGGSPTLGVYPLADTLPTFSVEINRIQKVFTYATCKIQKWSLSGKKGEPITLTLDIVGTTTTEGSSATNVTITAEDPFVFWGSTVKIATVTRSVSEFKIEGDNGLFTDFYQNNQTRAAIPEGPRQITGEFVLDYDANGETERVRIGSKTPAAFEATFIDAPGNSIKFACPAIIIEGDQPSISNRKDLMDLSLKFRALATASNNEMTATLTAHG